MISESKQGILRISYLRDPQVLRKKYKRPSLSYGLLSEFLLHKVGCLLKIKCEPYLSF